MGLVEAVLAIIGVIALVIFFGWLIIGLIAATLFSMNMKGPRRKRRWRKPWY